MGAITELSQLLAQMAPVADPLDYIFATVDDDSGPLFTSALMVFREAEATTLILPVDAVAGETAFFQLPRYRRITLSVHSSLDAVGLTSAVSQALTSAGIPANIVAAFYHDHVFVPARLAADAQDVLQALSRAARDRTAGSQ